jgi:hypothetical protein
VILFKSENITASPSRTDFTNQCYTADTVTHRMTALCDASEISVLLTFVRNTFQTLPYDSRLPIFHINRPPRRMFYCQLPVKAIIYCPMPIQNAEQTNRGQCTAFCSIGTVVLSSAARAWNH